MALTALLLLACLGIAGCCAQAGSSPSPSPGLRDVCPLARAAGVRTTCCPVDPECNCSSGPGDRLALALSPNNLCMLKRLDLSGMNVSAALPTIPASATYIDLRGNRLTGSLSFTRPDGAKIVDQIQYLYLAGNMLTGTVPPLVDSLVHLDLSGNAVSGQLPAFQATSSLQYLDLSHNPITGTIPPLGPLRYLQTLNMEGTHVAGRAPNVSLQHCLLSDTCLSAADDAGAPTSCDVSASPDCCPAGSYSPTGISPCTPCPAGNYSNATGATQCSACPPGSVAHASRGFCVRAVGCRRCPEGRELSAEGVCVEPSKSDTVALAVGVSVGVGGTAMIAIGCATVCGLFCLKRSKSGRRDVQMEGQSEGVAQSASPALSHGRMPLAFNSISDTPKDLSACYAGYTLAQENWTVDPGTVSYNSEGTQADVGVPLHQTVSILNHCDKTLNFRVELPTSNKFTMTASPAESAVKPGHGVLIALGITINCTTRVNTTAAVLCTYKHGGSRRKEYAVVTVKAETKLSTRIDVDELEVGTLVGEGSFGTVFRGTWRGNTVAIKQLRNAGDLNAKELLREIEVMECIRSPYIVGFFGAAITSSQVCLVTEYIENGSLTAIMRKYNLSTQYKLLVSSNVASGMKFLHQSNILHRDLKPDNVLVLALSTKCQIVCKIGDFGTSRAVSADNQSMKMTRGIGTPIYCAPEVLSGSTQYDKSADVYSFAVMAYALWYETEPFSELNFTSSYLLTKHVVEGNRPPLPSKLPVTDLITSCWAPDASARPTFDAIVSALAEVRESLSEDADAGEQATREKENTSAARGGSKSAPMADTQLKETAGSTAVARTQD
eukprot:m51a1_g2767 putative tyrosine (836) ;mRNA; r:999894-1003775